MALRIAFFMSAEAGGVAHTVLVRDVPGLSYGTVAARIEDTALRFLPRFVKKRLVVRQIISRLWSVFHVLITLSWPLCGTASAGLLHILMHHNCYVQAIGG